MCQEACAIPGGDLPVWELQVARRKDRLFAANVLPSLVIFTCEARKAGACCDNIFVQLEMNSS